MVTGTVEERPGEEGTPGVGGQRPAGLQGVNVYIIQGVIKRHDVHNKVGRICSPG